MTTLDYTTRIGALNHVAEVADAAPLSELRAHAAALVRWARTQGPEAVAQVRYHVEGVGALLDAAERFRDELRRANAALAVGRQ